MSEPPPRVPPVLLPELVPSRVVAGTLVVVAVGLLFALAYRCSGALFTLFAAMVLGTAVRPGLDWLQRRGLARHSSALLLYVALLGASAVGVVLVLPVASSQASAIATHLPAHIARARSALLRSESAVVRRFAAELPQPSAQARRFAVTLSVPSAPVPVSEETVADLELMARCAFYLVAVLLLGFHWTYSGDVTVRALLLFAPSSRGAEVRELIEAGEERVGGYVRGQLVISAVTAALSLVAFLAIGVPDALVLALVAGAMGAVPVVGGPIAGGVAVLVASTEPGLVPWVFGAALAIHLAQEYVVSPRVMGQRTGVHPFTILLAISAFGSLLGVAGAVLAIPMAAILQLLLERLVFDTGHDAQPAPAPTERGRRAVLALEAKTLALDARRQSRAQDEVANPGADEARNMVESIADDLDRILGAGPRQRSA